MTANSHALLPPLPCPPLPGSLNGWLAAPPLTPLPPSAGCWRHTRAAGASPLTRFSLTPTGSSDPAQQQGGAACPACWLDSPPPWPHSFACVVKSESSEVTPGTGQWKYSFTDYCWRTDRAPLHASNATYESNLCYLTHPPCKSQQSHVYCTYVNTQTADSGCSAAAAACLHACCLPNVAVLKPADHVHICYDAIMMCDCNRHYLARYTICSLNSLGVHRCPGRGGCDAHGGFGPPTLPHGPTLGLLTMHTRRADPGGFMSCSWQEFAYVGERYTVGDPTVAI